MASAIATVRPRRPFSPDSPALTWGRCCASGTASATQAGLLWKKRCAPAQGGRSSANSAPRNSRSFRPGSKPFPRRRQRHWRPITTFRGIAGCSILAAGPARSCSPSCDGTRRCTALYSSWPGACEVARRRLAGEPEGARIDVVEGDLVSDPLPPGHDVLLVANTVHVLSAAHNVDLLRKLRGHAAQGTHLLLVDLWMDSG